MRVNAMTSPLPVIATALPARNRRITRGRAEPGTLPSPARRGAGAGRAAWPAGDHCHFHAHSGHQAAAHRSASRLYRAWDLLCVAGVELGELPEIAQVHEAGDDVVERRAGRARSRTSMLRNTCAV